MIGDGSSLHLGSCLAGVPVRLHYTYFILLGAQVLGAVSRCDVHEYLWLVFLLYGPILLITVVIHEFGHAIVTQRFGGQCDGIVLWPLGGFALCGPTNGGAIEDFLVAFAGPATHVPQALFWLAVLRFSTGDLVFTHAVQLDLLQQVSGFLATIAEQSILLNIALLVYNLLIPAYPLDGGRCLAALLVYFGISVPVAGYITSVTAIVSALAMVLFGYMDGMTGNGSGILLILVGLFILYINVDLFLMNRAGCIHEHPLFSRKCYRSGKLLDPDDNGKKDLDDPCPESEAFLSPGVV